MENSDSQHGVRATYNRTVRALDRAKCGKPHHADGGAFLMQLEREEAEQRRIVDLA